MPQFYDAPILRCRADSLTSPLPFLFTVSQIVRKVYPQLNQSERFNQLFIWADLVHAVKMH